tara:strand:+ start:2600 stop:2791 length:192 start_codon:yes stop_codon:yes gene_type:complete
MSEEHTTHKKNRARRDRNKRFQAKIFKSSWEKQEHRRTMSVKERRRMHKAWAEDLEEACDGEA